MAERRGRMTMVVALLSELLLACSSHQAPAADDGGTDATGEVDAATLPTPTCGGWPRTAAGLRAALGERGRWTAAWQLDEEAGAIVDGFGAAVTLAPRGSPTYRQGGATTDDCAVGFDSPDDGFAATAPTFFDRGKRASMAVLLAVAIDGDGQLASKRAALAGPGYEVAVAAGTGALQASLGDGSRSVVVAIPIDHRDQVFHDVMLIIDRRRQRARLLSDLGRSPEVSIAALGSLANDAPFTLGGDALGPAAPHRLAFAAVADEVPTTASADGDAALVALRLSTGQPAPTVRPPDDMPWLPPWPIHRQQRGAYTIAVDPRSLRIPTSADLWVAIDGDDAAPGTAAAPMRSLHAALAAMTTATTIHIAAGDYDGVTGWRGTAPAHDVNIVAEGGRVRLTAANLTVTWRPSPGAPGTYQAFALVPYAVIETDGGGDPWLARRSSIAEVVGAPGTWTYAAGVVTVHPRDAQAGPAGLAVMPTETLNGQIDGAARSVYLEGLDLEGGYKALYVPRAHRLVVVDCSFRFGAGAGLDVHATDEALIFGAIAEANAEDGLAYSTTARVLEVDCVGRDNGRDGPDIDNGSTVHDGATVVRVGGEYRDNLGPDVADVNGARSWNLGTVAAGTRATASSQRVNFYIDGQMWLREVRAVDDSSALTTDLVAAPGAALHVHDSDYATVGGTGTVDSQAE